MKLQPFYLISLSLIGLANALYLSYFAYTGTVPSCTIGGCTDVLTSPYSKFISVPLAYWGVLYYVGMLGLAAYLAFIPLSKILSASIVLYAAVGVACSAVFVFYIQAVRIGSFCQYCLISAVITVLLLGVALWQYKTTN